MTKSSREQYDKLEVEVGRYNDYTLSFEDGETITVTQPLTKRSYYNAEPYDPTREDPQYSAVNARMGYGSSTMTSKEARAFSELLVLAAEISDALNAKAAAKLSEQAHAREAHLNAKIKEQEERQTLEAKMQEELQWYIGHKFKASIRNGGYRKPKTVFGTVTAVNERGITASERTDGSWMMIHFSDLLEFRVKYDDSEPRYTKVL